MDDIGDKFVLSAGDYEVIYELVDIWPNGVKVHENDSVRIIDYPIDPATGYGESVIQEKIDDEWITKGCGRWTNGCQS